MTKELIEKNVIKKLKSIKVCGDKAELWNYEAGTILNLIETQHKKLKSKQRVIESLEEYVKHLEASIKELGGEI